MRAIRATSAARGDKNPLREKQLYQGDYSLKGGGGGGGGGGVFLVREGVSLIGFRSSSVCISSLSLSFISCNSVEDVTTPPSLTDQPEMITIHVESESSVLSLWGFFLHLYVH